MIPITIDTNMASLPQAQFDAMWIDLQKRLTSFINRLSFDASFTRAEDKVILRLEISNEDWDKSNLFIRVGNILDNWEAANNHSGAKLKLPWHK